MHVTDSASVSTTAALSITINPPTLSITTSSLPAGTVGTPIRRRSPRPAARRRIRGRFGGSAAAGLTLAAGGTISGTPGTAGPSSFTVRVTDSASVSTTGALSITINPPTLRSLPLVACRHCGNCVFPVARGFRRNAALRLDTRVGPFPGLLLSANGTISGTPPALELLRPPSRSPTAPASSHAGLDDPDPVASRADHDSFAGAPPGTSYTHP